MGSIGDAGWQHCYRLANDQVELVVTGDVGPRIVRFGFLAGENQFWEYPGLVGLRGGDESVNHSGHGLWHAPETQPHTVTSDNDPLRVEHCRDGARFEPPVEASTGIHESLEVQLASDPARIRGVHCLHNRSVSPFTLAPWALCVLAPGLRRNRRHGPVVIGPGRGGFFARGD